jgi:hypothetical protein
MNLRLKFSAVYFISQSTWTDNFLRVGNAHLLFSQKNVGKVFYSTFLLFL